MTSLGSFKPSSASCSSALSFTASAVYLILPSSINSFWPIVLKTLSLIETKTRGASTVKQRNERIKILCHLWTFFINITPASLSLFLDQSFSKQHISAIQNRRRFTLRYQDTKARVSISFLYCAFCVFKGK
uniref:Uncharacterized protein n=1 Tax=Rhizophora mucronata TaxID=61149 RepID=A0A2P2J547_RHIMU